MIIINLPASPNYAPSHFAPASDREPRDASRMLPWSRLSSLLSIGDDFWTDLPASKCIRACSEMLYDGLPSPSYALRRAAD